MPPSPPNSSSSPQISAAAPPTEAVDGCPIVRLVELYKAFGSQQVLKGLNLEIPQAKTTVVLGPSGSGKSVILKHIAVLMRPDRGEVWFQDQRLDQLPDRMLSEARQQMGFLFQQSALFDSMSVHDNLEFPLIEHTRLTPAERAARVGEALATVDLRAVDHKFPAQLSGGQQKRVALARALILKPPLILYDEPTTGLDPERADGISELILKLRDEMGVSGIVVTHDLACAARVADKVVMLLDGKIAFEGTMDSIVDAPDERVRRFLAGFAIGNSKHGADGASAEEHAS